MPLRPFSEIERTMNAQGFTPEERQQVEADYKNLLKTGIPGEGAVDKAEPGPWGPVYHPPVTGADRTDVMARLTGVTNPAGQPTALDRPGFEDESFALKAARRAASRASTVAGAISYPFEEVGAGAGDVASRIAQSAGVPESVAGPASRFFVQGPIESLPYLPLVEAMPWMRAGKAAADAGAPVAQTALQHAGTVLRGVLGRTARPAAAGAVIEPGLRTVGRFGAGQPTTAEDVANEAAQGGAGFATGHLVFGEAIPGALEALRGMRRGPSVAPLNESGAKVPGTGTGSTPPGPGGTELPSSEASDQARWVEGETEEGTGAGSTPPRPVTAVSPASAGGPALDEAGVSTTFGMGLMTALQDGLVESDGEGRFTVTDAGLAILKGEQMGGETAVPPIPPGPQVPALVPGQEVRTTPRVEAAGPGYAPVPEEAIPAGVQPAGAPPPAPPGPQQAPLPARPEGIAGAPPSPELPSAAGAAGAAGAPSPDVMENLLAAVQKAAARARTPADKQFYQGQATALEQILRAMQQGEPPGKAVAVAGAAPGPPPSEPPARAIVRPIRPTPEEPLEVARPPVQPVEETQRAEAQPPVRPAAPPRPVEPPPAPGRGAAPGEEVERPPTREEHVAELLDALKDAQREMATEQNPRGEPLSGREIESAHEFAAELAGRLRALGVEPPGTPERAAPAPRGEAAPYAASRRGIRTLYHETDPETAVALATAHMSKEGLNVASDPDLALGQKRRGAVVEFGNTDQIGVQPIRKPGTAVAGQKEFEIGRAASEPGDVQAITLKPGVQLGPVERRILRNRGWEARGQPDGSLRYERPARTSSGMPVPAPERLAGAIRSEPEARPPTPTPPEAPARHQAAPGPTTAEQGVLGRPSPTPTPEAQPVSAGRKALIPPTPSETEPGRTGTPEVGTARLREIAELEDQLETGVNAQGKPHGLKTVNLLEVHINDLRQQEGLPELPQRTVLMARARARNVTEARDVARHALGQPETDPRLEEARMDVAKALRAQKRTAFGSADWQRAENRIQNLQARYSRLAGEVAREQGEPVGPVLRGELGKPESVRAEIPVTPGPKPKGKGKGTTLASGLGGLGEFGTSTADRAARAEADVLRRNPAVAKTLAHIGEPEVTHRWTFAEFYRRVFDNLDPVKRAVKELQEKPPAERNPYTIMRLYRGWLGKARNWIESAPRDYATGARIPGVKPLSEILQPVETDRDLFDAFLHARHALELHELGKASGLAPDVARETIARLESPRFQKAAYDLYAYQRALLDYTQEFNTPERRAKMRELYPLYVPYDRFLAEGSVLSRGGGGGARFVDVADPVRRLEGSERPITSPTETILRNTYALIKAAEQNRAGLTLGETLGRAPETTHLVERISPKTAETTRGDEPIVQVYSRGKRVFLRLDPVLHQAVLGLDQAPLSTLERLLALPATLLRKTATITPEFIPKNWTRDQYTAFITAGVHPLQSIRGIAHALGRDATYYDWLQSGGAQAGWVSLERSAVSDKLGEVLRNPSHRLQAGMLLKPWQMLGALSELVEEGTRIGAYEKAARAEHGPEAPPLRRQVTGGFASREATVDFSRIGASVHGLNAIVAFQNAAFQGVDRIVRAAKDNPASTMARIAAVVTLPSVYLWFANHDDPEYREIPQWEKDAFWHVKAGGRFFRIPKPWVEGVLFGSLPERFLDYLDQKDPAVFRRWASGAAGAVFPNMVPTFANPLVENYANWSTFKDRPIVPRGLEGVEPREQATPYTSLFARKLGDALNYAPAKIDNLIQGYTGGLGVLTTQGVDALLREVAPPTGGEPPTATAADIPGLRAFVSRYPTMQAQSVQDFYDLYAKAGEKSRTYKLLERQDPARAEAYAKANPEVFRMTGLAQVAKGLAANSRLLSGINGDASLTGDQKRAAIDTTTLESIQAARRALEVSRQPPTPLARMQERGAQARDAREQALRAVERGAVRAATGGGSEALRQVLLDMARKGAPVSSEDVSRRLKSPTFLHEVLTERLRRAPTPEERDRARAVLDRLTQAQAIESLRRLPKSTRGAMVAPP